MRNDSAPAVYGSNINGDICMTDTYFATCKIGLESVVAGELRDLGIEVLRVSDARVDFAGDYFAMARACLWLRTAAAGCGSEGAAAGCVPTAGWLLTI